ncbi:MAG: tRNA threonylcarbamoyladenosine dehydratase [Magnetococcales bacterium]|nr:tRNA threonylcarbamoyladenosine dehydratase [Magnetococcales bacterium]
MIDSGLFERTHILVGDEGVKKLQNSHILLAGLGGVGSFVAEALARAGIGRFTLIDSDVVAPSNINRQLPATVDTIGQKKVDVVGERLKSINPQCQLTLHDQFLTTQTIPAMLDQTQPDWVIDAIDSLNCKVSLIIESQIRSYHVASSMGAGSKLDPTRLQVGDLLDSSICPLASAVRQRLRRRNCQRGVLAVWSSEPPLPHKPPEATSQGRPRAINGTISYMPALFGLTLAGEVLRRIIGHSKAESINPKKK